MPISVMCPNGHALSVKDRLAGTRIRCPKCQAVVEVSPVGDIDTSSAATNDADADTYSLALGNDFDSADEPQQPRPLVQKKRTSRASKPQPKSKSLSPVQWAIFGGGGVATLLLVCIVGWYFLAGGDGPERADDAPTVAASGQPQSTEIASSAALPDREVSAPSGAGAPTSDETSTSRPPIQESPAPPPPRVPGELGPFTLDKPLIGFQLPGATWAAAYDEPTGRLALTNDETGIAIYRIEDLLRGQLKPERMFPTAGLPTAICRKVLADRRVFVFASQDEAKVQIIDADSLESLGEIALQNLKFVDDLDGSVNPADPYVYYSTQRSDQGDPETADRIGRIDVVKMVQGGQTGIDDGRFDSFRISPDGAILYIAAHGRAAIAYRWIDDGGSVADIAQIGQHLQAAQYGYALDPVGKVVALGPLISSPRFRRFVTLADFAPRAYFDTIPLVFGLRTSKDANELVLASKHDYRTLLNVPLPTAWKNGRGKKEDDARFDWPDLASGLRTRFAHFATDGTRRLALAIFEEHLVVVECATLEAASETSIIPRNVFPESVEVGRPVQVKLETEATDVSFEMVPNIDGQGKVAKFNERRRPPLGVPSRHERPQNTLALAASMSGSQDILFVRDVGPLSRVPAPATLQIEDEIMEVTNVDDFRDAISVKRTNGTRHSVTAPVLIIAADTESPIKSSLPTMADNTLSWTPSLDQIGAQSVRMRASQGDREYEWYWDVDVKSQTVDVPFYVRGFVPERGGTRGVVWGQNDPPGSRRSLVYTAEATQYYIGVVDLQQRRVLRQVEVDKPIFAATLHGDSIYAVLNSLDAAKPTHRTATQLGRFDVETLERTKDVEIPNHCRMVEVIGDRYVAAYSRWKGETYRFMASDLTPVEPALRATYPHPIAGRLAGGWLWDGVHWDDALEEPRLLLFPVQFEPQPWSPFPEGISIDVHTRGPTVGTVTNTHPLLQGSHLLDDYPGGLSCQDGKVQLFSWAFRARLAANASGDPLTTLTFCDPATLRVKPPKRSVRTSDYVTECDGKIFCTYFGSLYVLPTDSLVPPHDVFKFEALQSTFVLNPGRAETVQYSAPGAANYRLTLHCANLVEPFFDGESTDGQIAVTIEDEDRLVGPAIEQLGIRRGEESSWRKNLKEFQDLITPTYRAITGRKPKGIPVALRATVIADSADGQNQAGMVHYYLVDVPLKSVQAYFGKTR